LPQQNPPVQPMDFELQIKVTESIAPDMALARR